MHPLLESVFESRRFTNDKKEVIEIHSETSRDQCLFLQQIIESNGFTKSIEVGFAFGMSTLAITEAVVKNGGSHVVIDNIQNIYWGGNGVSLMDQAGYRGKYEFIEADSSKVLSDLAAKGNHFQFGYIDTTKLFDCLMVDFFFIDKMLEPGGIIVFDDVSFPAIRKLLRYLSQLPHYKVYGQQPANAPQKRLRPRIARLLRRMSNAKSFLKEEITNTDTALGINTHCVALQKISEDQRNYDWYIPF
jgi:predicted O-methyltransferase YrrM